MLADVISVVNLTIEILINCGTFFPPDTSGYFIPDYTVKEMEKDTKLSICIIFD